MKNKKWIDKKFFNIIKQFINISTGCEGNSVEIPAFAGMTKIMKFHRNISGLINKSLILCGIFLTGFFFNASAAEEAGDKKVQMCFFEMDNQVTSKNLAAKNPPGASIHRYRVKREEKETARQAYERMIKKTIQEGTRCDSVIASGHHTGDWFGTDGKGVLWLKDMEALSCKKEYQDWFQNVKALWLDGCNTVTDDFIKPWRNNTSGKKSPDSATMRYFKDRTQLSKIHMELYQQSYTGSLDEFSPLSSRYLRMFPNAQIYGFNGSAPTGEQAGSQSFIFKHLSDLGKALKAEQESLKARTDFERGLRALFSEDPCSEEALEAWEEVSRQANFQAVENQDYSRAKKLGCDLILAKQVLDDPESTEAQKNLAQQILSDPKYKNTEALRLANEILKQPDSKKAIQLAKLSLVQTLENINEADKDMEEGRLKYSHLLFTNLYDTWNTAKKYQKGDENFFQAVKTQFQTETFNQSVKERIQSPVTASLRKGDWIKFYTEINDINIEGESEKARFVKEHISNLVAKAENIFKDSVRGHVAPRRALAASVADQLLQYDLLDRKQMQELLNNKRLFPPDTKNPFIKDTWTKFKFTVEPNQVIPTVKKSKVDSPSRRRVIRVGSGLYLNQADTKLGEAKNNLAKLAQEIDVTKFGRKRDSQAFIQALHAKLKGQSVEEQADFLLKLSFKTKENLEKLVIAYANVILEEGLVRDSFCTRIVEESHDADREGYMIDDCP